MEHKINILNDKNIAPYLSEIIVVKDNKGNIVGKVPLGNYKPEYGKRLYRFAALSDIHFNEMDDVNKPNNVGNNGEGIVTNKQDAILDFKRAIKFIGTDTENEIDDIEFVCMSGDICQNLLWDNDELDEYKEIREKLFNEKHKKIYTCTGNHDTNNIFRFYDEGITEKRQIWLDAVIGDKNFDLTKNYFSVNHKTESGKNIKDNFYFLSMTKFHLGADGKPFEDFEINALETFLNNHKNERTFIFTHAPFPMRAGLFAYKYNNGYYWYGGKFIKKLTDLSYKYKNTIWFSGHSHYEWGCQGVTKPTLTMNGTTVPNWKENNLDVNVWPVNIDKDHQRECGWALHLPSASGIRPIENAFDTSIPYKSYNTSEFAIVDVYENYIDFRGLSLNVNANERTDNTSNLYYNPIAQYRLDTTIVPETKEHYDLVQLSINDFDSWNVGDTKDICITSVAFDSYHIGSVDDKYKCAAIYDAYRTVNYEDSPYNHIMIYRGYETLTYVDENGQTFTTSKAPTTEISENHGWQLYSEMRDLVNMRPKQYILEVTKDNSGFVIKNKSGYGLKVTGDINGLLSWVYNDGSHFNIEKNTKTQSSSCLVKQDNNDYLLRLKRNEFYMDLNSRPNDEPVFYTRTYNETGGHGIYYMYEVIRKPGNNININTLPVK